MKLILLGAPGAGKGTQAKKLEQKYSVPQISTGDMFRAAIDKRTEVGLKAKAFMDSGKLVPDDVVMDIVRERLGMPDTKSGFLFDGFPRTVVQAQALDKLLAEDNMTLDGVLCIDVKEEQIVKRLSGRRTCRQSGRIYNIELDPDEWEQSEDKKAGYTLEHRPDDKREVVEERMRVYEEQTAPLAEYYKRQGLLIQIDGNGTVSEVFDRIVESL